MIDRLVQARNLGLDLHHLAVNSLQPLAFSIDRLLGEAARVSKRLVLVKDHKVDGPFAQTRIALMDWAANSPYGVPCLYRYPTLTGWREQQDRLGLTRVGESQAMPLYPAPYRWVFTPRLQYLAALSVAPA